MSRDNFTKAVTDKLKSRVAHRCSNPLCRVPTSAPSRSGGVNNIGIAAHICAASAGGPRYDSSMSTTERKSIDNAIWLCSNCSIDIDRDQTRYPVDLLKNWKEKAECKARSELGKKLPSDDETVNTVTASLTGLGIKFVPTAISNVHTATRNVLESLDERFNVDSSFDGDRTTFRILAKEDVPLSFTISGEAAKDYEKQYIDLVEHGKDVDIDASSLNFHGSRLFEEVFNRPGWILNISQSELEGTQKLWLVDENTSLVETFDDIHGDLKFGSKSFTFTGNACGNRFNTSLSRQITEDKSPRKSELNFGVSYASWERVNIQQIPYFEKLFTLFKKMALGWSIFTTLEVDGTQILTSQAMHANESEFVKDTNSFLHYIHRCRVIADALKTEINFTCEVSYSSEEHKRLAEVANIIEGKKEDISEPPVTNIIVSSNKENIKQILAIEDPISMRLVQNESEKVKLFGEEITLPARIYYFKSVIPRIRAVEKKIQPGDTVTVEWIPNEESEFIVSYDM